LSFFLLEGVKGMYRLIYAVVSLSTLTQEFITSKKDSKKNLLLENLKSKITYEPKIEKKSKVEVIKLFKEKSNKIEKFYNLIDIATQWKLTHSNL